MTGTVCEGPGRPCRPPPANAKGRGGCNGQSLRDQGSFGCLQRGGQGSSLVALCPEKGRKQAADQGNKGSERGSQHHAPGPCLPGHRGLVLGPTSGAS